PRVLEPGDGDEREISRGEVHGYRVDASAGQFIRVRVEGRGALLRVSGDGTLRGRFAGDFTPMVWSRVAKTAMSDELRIESLRPKPRRYRVILSDRVLAKNGDDARVSAEETLMRGEIEESKGADRAEAALALYRESEREFASSGDLAGRAGAVVHAGQVL